ncbi:MAG TPA: TonB-dependent receptor [Bryobacteraceae bacterium]|nr:TonB-dependent receptor [Bryobacteraceae bacterium]
MKKNLFVSGIVLLLAALPALPQAAAGLAEISGTVQDNSGAVVPGAAVVISNPAKGVHLTLMTSAGGVFDAPALAPASGYEVTVTKAGFAQYDVKDITLEVGQILNIMAPLSLAGTATTVSVQAQALAVDDTKTDVSQVIDTQQIMDLPINARRVDSFVLLTPGVTNDGNFGLLTFRGVANGNTFLLDGNDSTEQFYGENNGRTRIFSQISQDAVQEFEVVSANFSAQYGNAMGGVVNTITKSGSNDLHASAYWFYRDQAMIAHDPFASLNPDEWRVQSGFTVGGAIVKNKLFYFLNGEFTRRNYPIVDSYIKAGIIDPVNQVFIGCTLPATPAQCNAINALVPRFFGSIPRSAAQDIGLARLDYHLNDRNTLSASFNFMHFNAPDGLQNTLVASTTGAAVNANGNDYGRVRNGKFSWTSVITPNLVNEFRYGLNTDLEGDNLNPALNGSLGLLDVSAAGVTLGAINYLPRVEPNETRNEISDNITWVKGRHIVKAGYDFNTTNDFSYFIQNLNGSYTYQNVTNFAEDFTGNTAGAKDWQSYSQTFGNAALNTRINQYGYFAEDQWKVTSRLTATVGLRYEYSQLPQPSVCLPAFPGTCHINSPNNEIMPRIGLAYRLNDKTVLRAGYGIFYSRVMAATLQNLFEGNGAITQSVSLLATQAAQKAQGPVFPNILTSGGAATTTFQFAAPDWKIPYSEQGVFAVERAVTHDIGVTASYIWSRGVQLYSERDLNLPALGSTTFTYNIDDQNNNQIGTFTTPVYTGSRPNPQYGAIVQDENGVTSFYSAATLQVNKRFSHGLQGLLSYTWSHEYDDGQGYGQATQNIYLSNAFAWLYNGNYKADKGNGLEDQPQRLVISWVWAPTFTHSTSGFARYLVNNWQLSSITTINSRRPYTSPTVRLTDTPVPGMFSSFSINGSGLSTRVPFWGVNSVYQPASYRADIRLTKVIPFGERYRLELNGEAFNISNSWSPTSMTSQAFTEAKGVLTLTPTAYGLGSGDAAAPDGTEARRLQVSARFSF